MARYSDHPRDLIDQTADLLQQRCLLADGSLLGDGAGAVWTGAHATALYDRFTGATSPGSSFEEQWRAQMVGADDGLRRFAAEVLLVHFLFASSVSGARKREVVEIAFEGSELTLPSEPVPVRALDQAIGHPGIGFNARRDLQVGYLIDFVIRWKEIPGDEQRRLLDDPWALRDFADDTPRATREMRHVLLHLLRPEEFERIASGSQKRQIRDAFSGLLEADTELPEDVDEQLLLIREQLRDYLPKGNAKGGAIDFYAEPLRDVWDTTAGGEGVADLDALLWKKQIILYGPPGTSKTFQADALARSLVRREAMRRWKPKGYFNNLEAVSDLVERNVQWVQLHPGIGYEEFVRGLRLEDGRTRYRPGLLFEFIGRCQEQPTPDGLSDLPVVLVLDEINRTDLSRMLGEAFSLLERDQRGRTRLLPGFDDGEEPLALTIPEDFYVIGTMNEIDQSVETLDFALRRRFLWSECPFERETLLLIIEHRWEEHMPAKRFSHDDAAVQLERFADRAQELNAAISVSEELGRQYQIGHTYFADITFFIGEWLRTRSNRPTSGSYLWTNSKRKPQPPLRDLWERALKPLLEQYLAGSDRRDETVEELERVYLAW